MGTRDKNNTKAEAKTSDHGTISSTLADSYIFSLGSLSAFLYVPFPTFPLPLSVNGASVASPVPSPQVDHMKPLSLRFPRRMMSLQAFITTSTFLVSVAQVTWW